MRKAHTNSLPIYQTKDPLTTNFKARSLQRLFAFVHICKGFFRENYNMLYEERYNNRKDIEMIIGIASIMFAIIFALVAVVCIDPNLLGVIAEEIKHDVDQITKPKGKHFA